MSETITITIKDLAARYWDHVVVTNGYDVEAGDFYADALANIHDESLPMTPEERAEALSADHAISDSTYSWGDITVPCEDVYGYDGSYLRSQPEYCVVTMADYERLGK